MLPKLHTLARSGLLISLLVVSASAQNHFIVRAPSATLANIKDICSRHGLQFVVDLGGSAKGLYILNSNLPLSQFTLALQRETLIQNIEQDLPLALPESSKSSSLNHNPQSTKPIAALVKQFLALSQKDDDGDTVSGAYLNQPAVGLIKSDQVHKYATGAGTVAILDTGADFFHPALRNSLIWGYDFINKIPGGFAVPVDLNQSTTSILDQSTTSILDQSTTSILDANSTVILEQSTTSILDQSTTSILDGSKPINDFGHGTMVAGLVHLVAPKAKIMPVKVFDSKGGSSLSLIIAGIHYAVDNGARVINMSFSMTGNSQELADAIAFAVNRGVIVVAAAGNEGRNMTVYPAGFNGVIGVGATDNSCERASFSNFGGVVDVAAPGAGVITSYPNNKWAAGWGTSFSAPLVAGAASLLVQLDSHINPQSATTDVENAKPLPGQQLGAGLLDLLKASSGYKH